MQEITIKALGRQGDGIADGPVFVPRGLPGEVVTGTFDGNRVVDMRIVTPSADRVSPPCRHFKSCGGCQMQHGSDNLLADWKVGIVRDALTAQGLEAPVRGIETSPVRSRRRIKLAARRTKSGAMAGFHARASDTLVDIVDCHLISPELAKGPELARQIAIVGTSRKGEISVQCTQVSGGLDVLVEGGKALDEQLRMQLPGIAAKFDVVRLTWSGDLVVQSEPPRVRLGQFDVVPPAGAFLQATVHGQEILQDCVMEAVEGAKSAADLFAGCGTFAFCLAQTAPVVAVESEKPMVRALQEAANHAGLTYPIKALARDLMGDPLIAAELAKFEAVVLDPPRSGAAAQCQELAKSEVPVIAYVSCDPITFGRDAAVLTAGGYSFDWVQVVDQFRWSPHVEIAARFSRAQ